MGPPAQPSSAIASSCRLSNVSYHVKVLVDLGVLKLVRTRKVRGAKERFYRVASDGQAEWVRVVLEDTRSGDSRFRHLAKS